MASGWALPFVGPTSVIIVVPRWMSLQPMVSAVVRVKGVIFTMLLSMIIIVHRALLS